MMGLGNLGREVIQAIQRKGHTVLGYDVDPYARKRAEYLGIPQTGDLGWLVRESELIFVAVQTPHDPAYEGITPLPHNRVDFEYSYLKAAVQKLVDAIQTIGQRRIISLISTVLPGTIEREIVPLLSEHVGLVYNPSFIAMGTVQDDFVNPEFVLLGLRDGWAAQTVGDFFATITDAPQVKTSITNAELIKTAYNTFIGFKIAFANTLMEICHRLPGTDVDEVTGALALATRRLLSPAYLSGGMGDGGGCHPRDNLALSWFARSVGLSYDLFEQVMFAREHQTGWLAQLMIDEHKATGLPLVILGKAFKPGVAIMTGSAAVLLANLLRERGYPVRAYDYYTEDLPTEWQPSVFLIGTKHARWPEFPFPEGSVVLDPWRYIPDREGVRVIPIGRYQAKVEAEKWPAETEA